MRRLNEFFDRYAPAKSIKFTTDIIAKALRATGRGARKVAKLAKRVFFQVKEGVVSSTRGLSSWVFGNWSKGRPKPTHSPDQTAEVSKASSRVLHRDKLSSEVVRGTESTAQSGVGLPNELKVPPQSSPRERQPTEEISLESEEGEGASPHRVGTAPNSQVEFDDQHHKLEASEVALPAFTDRAPSSDLAPVEIAPVVAITADARPNSSSLPHSVASDQRLRINAPQVDQLEVKPVPKEEPQIENSELHSVAPSLESDALSSSTTSPRSTVGELAIPIQDRIDPFSNSEAQDLVKPPEGSVDAPLHQRASNAAVEIQNPSKPETPSRSSSESKFEGSPAEEETPNPPHSPSPTVTVDNVNEEVPITRSACLAADQAMRDSAPQVDPLGVKPVPKEELPTEISELHSVAPRLESDASSSSASSPRPAIGELAITTRNRIDAFSNSEAQNLPNTPDESAEEIQDPSEYGAPFPKSADSVFEENHVEDGSLSISQTIVTTPSSLLPNIERGNAFEEILETSAVDEQELLTDCCGTLANLQNQLASRDVEPMAQLGAIGGDFETIDRSEIAYTSVAYCVQRMITTSNLRVKLSEFFADDGVSKENFPNLEKFNRDPSLSNLNHTVFWSDILPEIRWGSQLPLPKDHEVFRELCYAIYTQLSLLPFAKKQMNAYEFLHLDAHLRRSPFSKQLRTIGQRICNNSVAWSERFWINLRKLGSKMNIMDANLHNIPFNAGRFTYRTLKQPDIAKSYQQLRYATPTHEWVQMPTPYQTVHRIDINQEYAEFLRIAKSKGERVLYSNHQSQLRGDESKRVQRLAQLELEHANFIFLSLPVLHQVDDESISDVPTFCRYLEKMINDGEVRKKLGFYFSNQLSGTYLALRTKKWVSYLQKHFIQQNGIERRGLRCVYVTMLEMLLRQDIARALQVSFCNNTCKDAIDRGAIHLFCDLYWTLLISNREQDPGALENLALVTLYPAFGAKKQAILPDRFEQILSFAALIEQLTDEEKMAVRLEWLEIAKVQEIRFEFTQADQS